METIKEKEKEKTIKEVWYEWAEGTTAEEVIDWWERYAKAEHSHTYIATNAIRRIIRTGRCSPSEVDALNNADGQEFVKVVSDLYEKNPSNMEQFAYSVINHFS